MRRAAVVLAALLLLPSTATASTPHVARDCPQLARSAAGVKALIRCAAPKLGVSTSKALSVAWRESHYQPNARNSRSSACGVYQFVSGTWRYVVHRYLWGHRLGAAVCTNGRANVVLALRYVARSGWGPWT